MRRSVHDHLDHSQSTGVHRGRHTVNGPEVAERSAVDTIDEPSMRVFEYAICALAGLAALLLGFIR